MAINHSKIWERFWRDEKGRIILWQAPNLPIIGWLIFSLLSRMLASHQLKSEATFAGNVFLFAWAYLEITKGVNYFRRSLGAVVMAVFIKSLLG